MVLAGDWGREPVEAHVCVAEGVSGVRELGGRQRVWLSRRRAPVTEQGGDVSQVSF